MDMANGGLMFDNPDARIKRLAVQFTEVAGAAGVDDKEMVAALALAAGAAIRARWAIMDRDAAYNAACRLMKVAKDQL